MREEALSLAYSVNTKYRGIVYVATMDDSDKSNKQFKEYSCYIDEIPELLDRLNINVLSTNKFKIHYYITNNTFKTFKGRVDNLFSYNNYVIDIDCHNKNLSTTYKYTLLHNFVSVLKDELKEKFPLWNITHYTGQGLQLWWCFEQVSSKLAWPYRITQERLVTEISNIIKSHSEFNELNVDPGTMKENGYFRIPDTYNSHAEKETLAIIENNKRYQLQELIDASNANLEIPVYHNNTKMTNWDFMLIQNKKRMTIFEQILNDRYNENGKLNLSVNTSYGDGYFLLLYYNCAKCVYSLDLARKKTEKLNELIKSSKEDLKNIFNFIDVSYEKNKILKFKNATIIDFLSMTEHEQKKYEFYAFKGKWDWTLCKPNRSRDELRKQKRLEKETRIITLYTSGLTQEQVAIETGYCKKTVNNILKKHNINRKEERIRQIQLLKSENVKQKDVAVILDISVRTVKSYWNVA